jgi:hypothetical protein
MNARALRPRIGARTTARVLGNYPFPKPKLLCLALESRDAIRVRDERVGKNLDRDVAFELGVAGATTIKRKPLDSFYDSLTPNMLPILLSET